MGTQDEQVILLEMESFLANTNFIGFLLEIHILCEISCIPRQPTI